MNDEYVACLCRLLERFVLTQEKQEETMARMAEIQDRIARAQEGAAATQEEWTMSAKLARWADQPDTSSPQSGALDAIGILTADRDEWKRRALLSEAENRLALLDPVK